MGGQCITISWIILKWIFKKWGKDAWNGLLWLRIGIGDGGL